MQRIMMNDFYLLVNCDVNNECEFKYECIEQGCCYDITTSNEVDEGITHITSGRGDFCPYKK